MPKKWVIAPYGDPTNEPPWGSTLKIETGAENIMPTPLAGGQRKIICGANEISWPPAGGVGMIFSAPVSIFNVLSQGGSFKTPPFRQLPTFWAFWIQFQIFNVLPQGGSFVYSPLTAITHFWDVLDLYSNFQCATPRGLIRSPSLLNT